MVHRELCERDCTAGRETAPLEFLILGALRNLGRGVTFDDLEDGSDISEEVHRVFFHKFIEVGSTKMFDKWVILYLPTLTTCLSVLLRKQ